MASVRLGPICGGQLYDIWIEGQWIGSRRTIAHCAESVRNAGVALENGGWTALARLADGHITHYELFATDGPPQA